MQQIKNDVHYRYRCLHLGLFLAKLHTHLINIKFIEIKVTLYLFVIFVVNKFSKITSCFTFKN